MGAVEKQCDSFEELMTVLEFGLSERTTG